MKEGSSLFAKKKGTLIGLACAAMFAGPQVALAEGMPLSGQGLTLSGSMSLGLKQVWASGSNAGPAFDTTKRWEVWSGDSSIFLNGSAKLAGSIFTAVGFQVGHAFAPDDGSVSSNSGVFGGGQNTALGVDTMIGQVFFGVWDTPYKLTRGQNEVTGSNAGPGGSTAGLISTPGLGVGSCTNCGNGTQSGNGADNLASTLSFRRRQDNTVSWWSPSFFGLQLGGQYAANEEKDAGQSPPGQPPGSNPHTWSAALLYENGPLKAGFAWEQHTDYLWGNFLGAGNFGVGSAAAGAGTNSQDTGMLATVGYTFGNTTLSAIYERLKYHQGGPLARLSEFGGSKWYVGGQQRLGGPHTLRAYYIKALPLSCTQSAQVCPFDAETGMQSAAIFYKYDLNRDASINVSAQKIWNMQHAAYRAGGPSEQVALPGRAGLDYIQWGFGLAQRF